MTRPNFLLLATVATTLVIVVQSFSGTDEKFIKKYAMMKIYESCFGPEVIKQIRREMKQACEKCAALSEPAPTPAPSPQLTPQLLAAINNAHQQGFQFPPGMSIGHFQGHHEEPSNNLESDAGMGTHKIGSLEVANADGTHQPQFEVDKLQQAILAFRPHLFQSQLTNPMSGQMGPMSGQIRPYSPFQQQFYPNYPQNPMFYSGQAGQGYQGQSYQGPFSGPFNNYPVPFYPAHLFGQNHRMSRDMDVHERMDSMVNRISGRVKNVTCVMQELGYLDDNLEPSIDKIITRLTNLPIDSEVKKDMQEGVSFCQQFAQCIPTSKKESRMPVTRELVKPMFFFRCYKHKKLEACIMKDVRDRFNQESQDDIDLADGIRASPDDSRYHRRNSKDMKLHREEYDDFTETLYDFLYGNVNTELDSLF